MVDLNETQWYSKAYEFHYRKREYQRAYSIYKMILEQYPDSQEAVYARQQITNIQKMPQYNAGYDEEYINTVVKIVEENRQEVEDAIKEKELMNELEHSNIILATGHTIEGYKIKSYRNIVASQSIIGTGMISEIKAFGSDLIGEDAGAFEDKFDEARHNALRKLKRKAIKEKGNAVIDVKLDYEGILRNLICVFATGTAVYIEKEDESSKKD